jgi:ATP-binding cassette subfamily B protein
MQIQVLPRIDQTDDPQEKALIFEKFIELSKSNPAVQQQTAAMSQERIDNTVRAIKETGGKVDFSYIWYILLILLGVYIFSSLFTFVMQYVMSGVAQRTVYAMRQDVDNKLAFLPLKYYDSKTHGEILSRVTNDVDTIAATLQQSLTQLITSVLQIIGFIIMMLTISPVLTLIVLVTLPLYVFSTAFVAKKSQKYFAAQQKELGELSGHVEEMYTGHKIVKVFGHERESIEEFSAINARLYNAGWKAQFVSGVMFPLMNFVSNFATFLFALSEAFG